MRLIVKEVEDILETKKILRRDAHFLFFECLFVCLFICLFAFLLVG